MKLNKVVEQAANTLLAAGFKDSAEDGRIVLMAVRTGTAGSPEARAVLHRLLDRLIDQVG